MVTKSMGHRTQGRSIHETMFAKICIASEPFFPLEF